LKNSLDVCRSFFSIQENIPPDIRAYSTDCQFLSALS
jgi:hypothetical protein